MQIVDKIRAKVHRQYGATTAAAAPGRYVGTNHAKHVSKPGKMYNFKQKVKRISICRLHAAAGTRPSVGILVLSATCIKTRYFIQTALLSLTLA